MSIEIRTFDGSSEQLSEFVVGTWLKSYSGKMPVPEWHARYFDWQMTAPEMNRDLMVSAWKGSDLIGCILGIPYELQFLGEKVLGAHGSWLTVEAEYRREGVAKQMVQALDRRQKEMNCIGRIGYAYQGSKLSLGPRFWRAAKKRANEVKSVRLWARLLDSPTIQKWTNQSFERIMLKLLPNSVCSIGKPDPKVSIRPYEPDDLAACLEIVNAEARTQDLAILWDEERLARQLSYDDFVKTLVVVKDDKVCGLVNYHLLPLHLSSTLTSAVVDLLSVQNLSTHETVSLLKRLCLETKEAGGMMVLLREFSGQPLGAMLQTRFVPQKSDSMLLFSQSSPEQDLQVKSIKNVQVLWR